MSLPSRLIVHPLQQSPRRLVEPVAMRYIAGEGLGDAVRVVRGLNAKKMMAPWIPWGKMSRGGRIQSAPGKRMACLPGPINERCLMVLARAALASGPGSALKFSRAYAQLPESVQRQWPKARAKA